MAAIAPFYLATQFPGGWFDQHDEVRVTICLLLCNLHLKTFLLHVFKKSDLILLTLHTMLVPIYQICVQLVPTHAEDRPVGKAGQIR